MGHYMHVHKHGGGVGRSERSFWKHDTIRKFMGRQLPVLNKRGKGLIIDMHAGDGEATPHVQLDMWADGSLTTTPHIALGMAHDQGADVWLCERSAAPRKHLIETYGNDCEVLRNHRMVKDRLEVVAAYPWVIVLNDPNGHSLETRGLDVMQAVSKANPVSDFILVINVRSIRRHLGVGKSDNTGNVFALNVEACKAQYAWMLTPSKWAESLGKRQWLASEVGKLSNGMSAQVLLISNFIPGHRQ